MSERTPILIAAGESSDGDLIAELLAEEFEDVIVSADPDRQVEDFERHRPHVLVLAYKALEDAERYYLGLFRRSALVHSTPHRTLLLCTKDEVRRAYQLCRSDHFDDYVLFWPMTHDALRLPMSVHLALRAISEHGTAALTTRLALQARRIADLESTLDARLAEGGTHAEGIGRTLQQAQTQVDEALSRLSDRVLEEVAASVRGASEAVRPMREWMGSLRASLEPQIRAANALAEGVRHLRRQLLLVDDDEFLRTVLGRMLEDEDYEVLFAGSAAEALAAVRRRRPELILMDVGLPDLDGVAVTRRLKEVTEYAAIPIVMMTGQSERRVILDSLKAGAADFVVKPFERDVLMAKVARLLN